MHVVVGSLNPVKIRAVEEVFGHYFGAVDVSPVETGSSVHEQPKSEDEKYQGALHRAKFALRSVEGSDYGVGIEGGVHSHSYGWYESSLVVIADQTGKVGIGASGGLVLPEKIINRLHTGENLEEVIDKLYGTNKIGRGIGMFGVITNEYVTRKEGTKHGIAFALARFLHPDLFE